MALTLAARSGISVLKGRKNEWSVGKDELKAVRLSKQPPPIEVPLRRGGSGSPSSHSSLMSALTLFEILKFNEPIRSSILPARASALFSFCGWFAEPLPRKKKGGLARAFVIRFNGVPFGLFEFSIDQKRRPTSSTSFVNTDEPHLYIYLSSAFVSHPLCSFSSSFGSSSSSSASLLDVVNVVVRLVRDGRFLSRARKLLRAEPLVRWHVKFLCEGLIITRRASALWRATKRIDLFYKLG